MERPKLACADREHVFYEPVGRLQSDVIAPNTMGMFWSDGVLSVSTYHFVHVNERSSKNIFVHIRRKGYALASKSTNPSPQTFQFYIV